MREILFKAKRIDDGEWVEGLLWKKKYKSNKIFISCFPDKDDNEEVYVIDETTICQYTGLTDKNGNKIWENDYVQQFADIDELGNDLYFFYQIHWDDEYARFYGEDIYSKEYVLFDELEDIEVIGNAFDNPELLNTTKTIGYADNGGLMSAT